jgi:hypothetical protein
MYEFTSIIMGIALYFLATRQSAAAADAILASTVVIAFVGLLVGVLCSWRRPALAAAAPWFWGLLLMAVGALVAWGAIAIGASLISSAKTHRDPDVEIVVSAVDVALAIVVAKFARIPERVGAKWLTSLILQARGGDRVADFPQTAPLNDPFRLAYSAARDDTFSDVEGWGFGARRRRLQLVAAAVPPASKESALSASSE